MAHDYNAVSKRLKEIIVSELNVPGPPDEICDEAALFWKGEDGRGLSLDSIEALTLIVLIDTEFGVKIPEDLEEGDRLRIFSSVASLAKHVVASA
jgi:acyl carrier protein